MLGEELELNDIPFLFQEHTTVSKVIEPSDVYPCPRSWNRWSGRIC